MTWPEAFCYVGIAFAIVPVAIAFFWAIVKY